MDRFADFVRLLSRIGGVFAALLILLSILVVCEMIFVRAVLQQSSIWQTEFVTFSLIAATFIGAPYILLTHGHVNVDIVPLMIGHAARRALALVATLIALGFCLVFLYNSVEWWYEAWEGNLTTSSLARIRLWIPYGSVPIGLTLLCLQYIVDLWALLAGHAMPFGMKPEDRL